MADLNNHTEPSVNFNNMYEILIRKCQDRFGHEMAWPECYTLLTTIKKWENNGLSNCYPGQEGSIVEHNAEYDTECSHFDHMISRYVLPWLLMLCLFGNVLNIMIYRLPYFDGSSSVHFLRVKALANLIFVQSRLFEIVHAWSKVPEPSFEAFYWNTRPFIITIANICGTISTWMTLLVTIETVLCVLLPFSFRQYCTRKTTLTLLLGSFIFSTALHLTFLSTHTIGLSTVLHPDEKNNCFWTGLRYSMRRTQLPFHEVYEKVYYWLQMTVAIVVPTVAMLICSILIVTQFTFKELGEAFSQRRKCVIRLTVATTASHLLLEGPALFTFGAAALKGAGSEDHDTTMCILNHTNNFLSIVNATIPFFVFLVCNEQFRHMTVVYLKAQLECHREKKQALLATAANRVSRGVSYREYERSNYEQTLLVKISNC